MKYILYKVTFPNNKIYVGITTKSLKERKRKHYVSVQLGSNFKFHNALRKYKGKEKWKVISTKAKSWQELCKLEIRYIKKYKSVLNGYNSTAGGEGNFNPSEITRERMSIWQKGKVLTQEHKRKLSEAKLGKKYGKRQNKYKTVRSFNLIDKADGRVLNTFSNISECARYLNVSCGSINKRVKTESTYKNYIFKFIGEPNVT